MDKTKLEFAIRNTLPSADARYIAKRIVTAIWMVGFVVPLIIGIVIAVVKSL